MKKKVMTKLDSILKRFKVRLGCRLSEPVSERKIKFSKKVLIYSFIILTFYTFIAMFIRVKFDIEPNSNLTDNVHRIWGLEIALLMLKTIIDDFRDMKLTQNDNDKKEENDVGDSSDQSNQ